MLILNKTLFNLKLNKNLNESVICGECFFQLIQVNQLIAAESPGPKKNELICLKNNFEELLKLTQESLHSLVNNDKSSDDGGNEDEDPFAKEYALFKVIMFSQFLIGFYNFEKVPYIYHILSNAYSRMSSVKFPELIDLIVQPVLNLYCQWVGQDHFSHAVSRI